MLSANVLIKAVKITIETETYSVEWECKFYLIKKYYSMDFRKYSSKCIFTKPSAWIGCDIRSIFKQSLTGLTSEFSFSKTGCHPNVKEPSQPYFFFLILLDNNMINNRISTLPKGSGTLGKNNKTCLGFQM